MLSRDCRRHKAIMEYRATMKTTGSVIVPADAAAKSCVDPGGLAAPPLPTAAVSALGR
ncbi:hypothetical protein RA8P2_00303 (plasmid) [Variovorax sp. RA8]|nr:hypothetical protein RA8P2_00303 [Variovorax sp. RA8]